MSLMSSFWDTISSTAESAVESVKETASEVADTVEDAAESTYEAAGDAVDAVEDAAESAYDSVSETASDVADSVEDAAESAYDAAGDAVDAVEDAAESAYDSVSETASDVAESVEDAAESVYDAAGDAVDAVEDAAESAYDSVSETASDVADAVEDAAESAYDAAGDAVDAVEDAAESAYDSVSETASDVADAVEDAAESAYDAASDAVEDAVDAAGDLIDEGEEALEDALEAVEDAAEGVYDDAKDVYQDVADGVDDVLDDVFGEGEDDKKNREKNIAEAKKQFGSGSEKFKALKGAESLNPRQKQIFDEKLKQVLEKDPRAKRGDLSEAELKELAQQAAEVSDKLSKTPLGDPVNDLAAKSAKLKDNLVKLQNAGWVIKAGAPGSTSFADRNASPPFISIDPSLSTKDLVETLAHETGHADFTKPADPSIEDPSPDVAKAREFIRKSVENSLLDEGQAQIIACQAAKELEDAGQTGINIPGGNSAKYKAVYAKIAAGTLTMDAGRREMAKIMATETVSGPGARNYIDYYSDAPRANWNAKHPTAQVPSTTPRVGVFP